MNTSFELFGIECNKGWEALYLPLIERCKEEGVTIFQIKEKFGGLRFYVDSASPELFQAIDLAEAASFNTCEDCGEPGKLRTEGRYWIRTLCDEHAKEPSK